MDYKTLVTRKHKSQIEDSPAVNSAVTEPIQLPLMTDTPNYLNLFKETDLLDGGDNFRCLCYRQEGITELRCQSPYPMLFVLQGELNMQLKTPSC